VSFVNVTVALYGSWHANEVGPARVIEFDPFVQASRMWRAESLPHAVIARLTTTSALIIRPTYCI